jgi:deazaflavin-dependent oxidoreductase (nitroreductase family)
MAKYVPSPQDWVREQVDLYESSGGTRGTTLRDTGLPVVIVTNRGNKTGAIRKTPLMRVKEGDHYTLIGSQGGAPKDPAWVHNLRADSRIELRDETVVRPMRVRRSRTRQKGPVCGHWPWRHTRHTRNIRRARNVKFRSLSPSRNLGT